MTDDATPLHDWREEFTQTDGALSLSLLVNAGARAGEFEQEDTEQALLDKTLRDLEELTQADSVHVAGVDPSVGASGYGIGVVLEFIRDPQVLSTGADIIAWATAAMAAAPRIRRAADYLKEQFSTRAHTTDVIYSAEAIQILTVAEVVEGAGISPANIETTMLVEHKYPPPENSITKQQLYSAYTVTAMTRESNFYRVWSYLVTCHGRVVSSGDIRLPVPNGSHWSDVELPSRKLRGITRA